MLDDSHVITNIIGDRFAALDYCYVLLEEIHRRVLCLDYLANLNAYCCA